MQLSPAPFRGHAVAVAVALAISNSSPGPHAVLVLQGLCIALSARKNSLPQPKDEHHIEKGMELV